RHWWSYNHKASPWVEIWPLRGPRPRLYAMVALARATAPAAHRHTWRQNPKSSPLVELQSQGIAVGGDLAVAQAPTKAIRDGCARWSNSAGSESPYGAAESESVAVGEAAIAIHLHG